MAEVVTATIDGHETILTFAWKDDAEKFAEVQGRCTRCVAEARVVSVRLAAGLVKPPTVLAGGGLRERAGRHGQWFAAKARFNSEEAERDEGGGEARPLARLLT